VGIDRGDRGGKLDSSIATTAETFNAGDAARCYFSFDVTPDLSTADWAFPPADQVYRAMVAER
jgi:hypothetical protein